MIIKFFKKRSNRVVNKNKENDFLIENYMMNDTYDAEKLVISELEYISSEVTEFGPMVKKEIKNIYLNPLI